MQNHVETSKKIADCDSSLTASTRNVQIENPRYVKSIMIGASMDTGDHFNSIQDGWGIVGREVQKKEWLFTKADWFIIVHIEGVFVKRIIAHDVENGIITCNSLNPDKDRHPDFNLKLSDCKQIFVVVELNPDQIYEIRNS